MVLALHLVAAILWGLIVQWPYGPWLFHALIALGVLHLLSPFWFHLVGSKTLHRAFLFGPLVLAGIDAAFLFYALREDLWRDLTPVFAAVLGGIGAIALAYALLVMSLLAGVRTRRQRKREERSGNDGRSG